jgi:hypothetical protein
MAELMAGFEAVVADAGRRELSDLKDVRRLRSLHGGFDAVVVVDVVVHGIGEKSSSLKISSIAG